MQSNTEAGELECGILPRDKMSRAAVLTKLAWDKLTPRKINA
jgi:hypothetical protein